MENELISLDNYLMGRDEEYKEDFTKELRENASELLTRVNAFLKELNEVDVKVSSGWRPKTLNDQTPGAGKTSAHISCQAVDIMDDKDQRLCNKIKENLELLEKYDLYMENPDRTKGKYTNWCHLQTRKAKSGRIFQP